MPSMVDPEEYGNAVTRLISAIELRPLGSSGETLSQISLPEDAPVDVKLDMTELEGAVVYFLGPTPARPGKVIGSAGPTTSSRMDAFSPKLIAAGLKAMIGKGYRGAEVRQALKEYAAVHLAAIGGAGALLSKHIVAAQIIAYEDLGTEAIRRLEVIDFPAVVAYDSAGNSVYEKGAG